MKTKMRLFNLLPALEQEMQDSIGLALEELELSLDTAVVKRVAGIAQKAESDGEKNKCIKILASTREIDRDNEIIFPKGMDISQFKMNPKILNGHDFSKDLLAKAISVSRTEFGIPMTIEFAPTEEGEKFRMLSQFMPLTFSIGFIPTDVLLPRDPGFGDLVKQLNGSWDEFRNNKTGDKVSAFIRKGILLETSIVNIPSNAGAIQLAAAKAIEAGLIEEKDAVLVMKSFDIEPENKEPEPTKIEIKEPDKIKATLIPTKAERVIMAQKHQPIEAKLVYRRMNDDEQAEKIVQCVKNSIALQTGKV